jgi:hypothetical protein
MKGKNLIVSAVLAASFISILAIFWYQENQYLLPTPVPENYEAVNPGEFPNIDINKNNTDNKPVLLHFFNPDCPCSKFNIEHFRQIVSRYKDQIHFYAVLHTEDTQGAKERFLARYELNIPVILDTDKKIAIACGVYSTPQAALITPQGQLYYRGNYNKSRYCTDANSNFAQMAIDSLLRMPATHQYLKQVNLL